MQRRKFIKHTVSFAALIALHKSAQAYNQLTRNETTVNSQKARFSEITLYTSKLKEQFHFYSSVLELPIIAKSNSQFEIKIGASVLRFKQVNDTSEPFYHYAINIPSNKYEKAKTWLSERTSLLLDAETGEDLQYFDFWDAHAMYFKDSSGNIGELIARHTLQNDSDGEFGISDLLCISEIGTPVENPSHFASELKTAYHLETYGSSMFIGDEKGLFVAAPVNRPWFPENIQKAAVHPTEIQISAKGVGPFRYQDYPYLIKNNVL